MSDILQLHCPKCGTPIGFDIRRQKYRCTSCSWQATPARMKEIRPEWLESVGTFAGQGRTGQVPEAMIPFALKREEAMVRMYGWGKAHNALPEGRLAVEQSGTLTGIYLPFQLLRGPVHARVKADERQREDICEGCLEGFTVSMSGQMNEAVLDRVASVDWSEAEPFGSGSVIDHPIQYPDLTSDSLEKRVQKKAQAKFLPDVRKALNAPQAKLVSLNTDDLLTVPVLLPFYLVRSGRMMVIVNGQTGEVAATNEGAQHGYPWLLEPLVYTVFATFLLMALLNLSTIPSLIAAVVLALFFFGFMGKGRRSLIRKLFGKKEPAVADADKEISSVPRGDELFENPLDNTPYFPARDHKQTTFVP